MSLFRHPGAVALWALIGCAGESPPPPPGEAPGFVGRASCRECHTDQVEAFTGSHHDLAMQPASEATVLGDFDGAEYTRDGVTSTFFRRGESFVVRTDGPDGTLRDFDVAYTFGVEPLQQYLVELPGGRLQALGLCWDARTEEEGGQRWFFLYPDERVPAGDELHWTGLAQNWNHQCADCHSTNLRKNYDLPTATFETTWSEIDVSCEACHGPASRHVELARAGSLENGSGFVVELAGSDHRWVMNADTGIAERVPPLTSSAEIESCAPCHSRRSRLHDGFTYGAPLLDGHRLALLEEGLYFADGQILEEVYVHGSFLQSKMHAAGVTCSDCHDPHSTSVPTTDNALCAKCHLPERFDSPSHHFHPSGSEGARCVSCHMPSRTYMVVDDRRDHGFRPPRPDLTRRLGVPNACNGCHADRSAEWAEARCEEWYGKAEPHWAEALHAGRTGEPGAAERLRDVAANPDLPAIVRATAVAALGRRLDWVDHSTLRSALADPDPLVRRAGTEALEILDPRTRLPLARPLLEDPVLAVRTEAARVLAGSERTPALVAALEEYRSTQLANADRPESHLNLGNLERSLGNAEAARSAYETATSLDATFVPAIVNLADLLRAEGRDAEGEEILWAARETLPPSGDLDHALALTLIRAGRVEDALPLLSRASELRPDDARYAYVQVVALHDSGRREEALRALRSALERHRWDPALREAAEAYGLPLD